MVDFFKELFKCRNIKMFSLLFLFSINFLLGLTSLFVFKKELIVSFDTIKLLLICSSIYLPIIIFFVGIMHFYFSINMKNYSTDIIYLSMIVGSVTIASVVFPSLYIIYKFKIGFIDSIGNILIRISYTIILCSLFQLIYNSRKNHRIFNIVNFLILGVIDILLLKNNTNVLFHILTIVIESGYLTYLSYLCVKYNEK